MKSVYEERPWLKHNPSEFVSEFEVPMKSLGEVFDEATDKWKKRTAIIFYGNRITFGELREKVDRLSNALHSLGIKKGDRVGFLMLNSPEFIISFYAVTKIGAVMTPISPVYVSIEIKHQLLDSEAETLICHDILYEGVEKAGVKLKNIILTNIAESLPRIKRLIGKSILRGVYQRMSAPSPEILKREGIYQFEDLIKKYSPHGPRVEINPRKDLVELPYTGGTTGAPKGVMITHYNAVANLIQFGASMPYLEEGKETIVAFMPYYHAAGLLICVIYALLRGFTQVTLTSPDVDYILNSIVKYNATWFQSAPTLYEILKDYDKTDRVRWRNLKIMMAGADALHEATAKGWEDRTGAKLTEAYGLTETVSAVSLNPKGKEKYGSIGIPLLGTEVAIIDPDEDKFLALGELGEIAVMGPQVTKGYWKNPEDTKACEAKIDGKRWWRTGDIGRMDEDGYFFIYDRKRDLIKYKGLKVFAREVEEVLKTHPKIKEVGVVGEPDVLVGENVKAVVVLESDARGKISEAEIIDFCEGKLAHYKIPKIVEFAGEIPKTDIGKVSRREIRSGGSK